MARTHAETGSPAGAAAFLLVPNGPLRAGIDARAVIAVALVFLASTAVGAATATEGTRSALEVIWTWSPLLLWGFLFNLFISAAAMLIGTAAGVPLGVLQTSDLGPVRWLAWLVTQFFRNSPWLVLLFLCVFLIPYRFTVLGYTVLLPDWSKAILGFALPVMANVSEIVRGAIQSVPTGQWESSASLGFNRRQTLAQIILPQCYKRMLPPWMNLYSLITMSTVNASVVGVSEMITLTNEVLAAEGSRPALLAPLYGFALVCFFLYCYPIARWTQALERRFNVRG
ncbi:MAG: amino acid ABC transporter permease [Hyphomicrobiaceae bacterium]|nr:amino acid ABC transporter permease [Hyphomicrobiaceae bacterium]